MMAQKTYVELPQSVWASIRFYRTRTVEAALAVNCRIDGRRYEIAAAALLRGYEKVRVRRH